MLHETRSASEPLLSLGGIDVDRGGKPVLKGVRMEIERGESWAILGPSGSGKSTLAAVIAGKAFYQGEIRWSIPAGGSERRPAALVEQGMASFGPSGEGRYYQQRYNADEADEGPILRDSLSAGGGGLEETERWAELLQLTPLLSRPVIQLSNGERKRAQIARALVGDPALLLLDDPFSGLDAQGRETLRGALRGLCEAGTQIVVFMSRGEVPDFVTRVASLKDGELSEPLPRESFVHPSEGQVHRGRALPSPRPASRPPFEIALRLVDAVVQYGDTIALDRVSWEVRRGERWTLTGPNGAGKTTLLSLVTADNPQGYANEMYLFDRRRGSGETIWDIKRGIGFVSPELHAAFPRNVTCEQVVTSGLFDSIGVFDEPTGEERALVLEWLAAIGEEESRERRLDELPLGRQRMVLLARALVKEPPLLILDEPCQALDDEQVGLFLDLLDGVCEACGTTMIFVSHVETEFPACATKALRLEAGQVVYCGERAEAGRRA